MTEEKDKVGKDSAAVEATTVDSKNKTAKMSVDQAFAEIESLKKVNADQLDLIGDLTRQLDEANKVLEGQEKARLISEILPRSSFKLDELVGKSVDALMDIRSTLEVAMPPKFNSVRFGVQSAGLSDREKGLTVGDLSWSTAQRRKGAS